MLLFRSSTRMPSVALIGGDGAGKTTIARMLEESGLLPFKYLYMGVNTESSNVALPTSRLADFLKRRRGSARTKSSGSTSPSRGRSGLLSRLRAVARLANRVAEECFRQSVSWWHRLRGRVVLYDRHFVFDFAEGVEGPQGLELSRRLHTWFLRNLYPTPDMVIFLDAPPEVLFSRKGEATLEYLQLRREAFLRMGETTPNFVRIDAAASLETVYEKVVEAVIRYCNKRGLA